MVLHSTASWSQGRPFDGIRELGVIRTGAGVSAIAFAPASLTLAAGVGNDVLLYDVEAGKELKHLSGHKSRVVALAYNMDGKTLASGADGEINLWDTATGKLARAITEAAGVTALAFSHDGKTLAAATSGNSTRVTFWSVETGAKLKDLGGIVYPITTLRFDDDGATMTAAGGGMAHTEPARATSNFIVAGLTVGYGMTLEFSVIAVPTATLQRHFDVSPGGPDVAVSHDGRYLAGVANSFTPQNDGELAPETPIPVSNWYGEGITVWKMPAGEELGVPAAKTMARTRKGVPGKKSTSGAQMKQRPLPYQSPLSWSWDGKTLAIAGGMALTENSFGTLELWNGGPLPRDSITLGTKLRSVDLVEFSPGGHYLVAGSLSSGLWVWQLPVAARP